MKIVHTKDVPWGERMRDARKSKTRHRRKRAPTSTRRA